MKPKTDGWNVVLRGFWNRMILTPPWIQRHLNRVPTDPVGLAIDFTQPTAPPQFLFDGIGLRVEGARLVLSTSEAENDRLDRIESAALRILEELPKTPVSAVGVNFRFVEEDAGGPLLQTFNLIDSPDLAHAGFSVRETAVTRALEREGYTLNLTTAVQGDNVVRFDFNFHRTVGSAAEAQEFLRGRVRGLRVSAEDLLQRVYHLNQGADDAHAHDGQHNNG
jgi:hypothetical protein